MWGFSGPASLASADHGPVHGWGRRIGALLAVTAVIHLPSLFNPFFIDDYVYLNTVQNITWSNFADQFLAATMDQDASGVWWTPDGLLPFYRPLAILSFAVDYRIWGLNPFGYHLTNLLLHVLCTYLAYSISARLIGGGRWGLLAAAIFTIHPAHMEALLWVSGRFDLMVCAATMAAVLAHLKWQANAAHFGWGLAFFVFFGMGLACKETALILPAFLVLSETMGWRGQRRSRWPRAWRMATAAITIISLLYLSIRFYLFGGLGSLPPPYGVDLSSPRAAGTILWNFAQYLLDCVFWIQIDAIYLSAIWERYPAALIGLSLVATAVLYGAWRVAGRTGGCRVGFAWLLLFTLPALLAMPGERNIYLANFGVALIAGSVASEVHRRNESNPRALLRFRHLLAVVGTCAVVVVGVELAVGRRIGQAANQVFVDVLQAIPHPPRGAHIFVVNQCPLNAVGFNQGMQLRYGRDDLTACALTLSPNFHSETHDEVFVSSDGTLRIERRGGFLFSSFIEQFLLFSQPVTDLNQSAGRVGIRLPHPPQTFHGLTSLELELPPDVPSDRVFLFRWDNAHVKTIADIMWRAEWPRLVRCQPKTAPADVAGKE